MKGGQVYSRYSAAFMAINLTVCFFSCCVYMVSGCRGISSGALACSHCPDFGLLHEHLAVSVSTACQCFQLSKANI